MQTLKILQLTKTANRNVIRLSSTTASSGNVEVNHNAPLKSWREIPGPSHLPILGPLHHFIPGGLFYELNGVELTNKLYEKFGPIVRLDGFVGKKTMLILFEPESSATILRNENQHPLRPGFDSLEYYRKKFKKDAKEGRPTGLITDHGNLWKELRTTVNPVLLQPKTIKLHAAALNEVAMDMIERIKLQRDENFMVKGEFDADMYLWALESIGVVALGCRLGCLDPDLPEDSPAKNLIKCIHELFILTDKLNFKPSLWRIISTPNFKRAMSLYAQHESICKHFISQAMQELKSKQKSDDEKGILEKLLEINEEFAHIMASDMLFTGVDSAGNTVTATLYLLAVNPEKQNKLREELHSGDEKKSYLKACLKESLRMMPFVSGNIRITTKEYNLLGYKIPPNMTVAFGHQNMSLMDKEYPQAKEYLPERWLVGKEDLLYHRNAHPFAYNPFGFGVRGCIGHRIAELELETFTARMVENFQVEWFGPPPKVKQTALNHVQGPFNFIFKDAPK